MTPYKKKQSPFRDRWKEYFSLSNKVRRGLMVLFGLILAEIAALLYLHYKPTSAARMDVEKFKKEIDAFYSPVNADSASVESAAVAAVNTSGENTKVGQSSRSVSELFSFNPNHLPDSNWKRLGFSERQIRSIKNYEAKGGTFRTKEDVKKMYAIHSDQFKRIEPFINIPEIPKATIASTSKAHENFLVVDIGTADSVELEKLPMVGEYLAQKISGYRDKLGGFYSIDQLKEVRGMRDSAYQVILPHITLKDSSNLRKINLNTADFTELNRHPYIDQSVANIIISYRKQHGSFSEVSDLRKVALVDAELYRKIAPYLKTQ